VAVDRWRAAGGRPFWVDLAPVAAGGDVQTAIIDAFGAQRSSSLVEAVRRAVPLEAEAASRRQGTSAGSL
jgi:hypothetical protein